MRVLVNQLSALRRRTGIGHYVAELIRCLRQEVGDEVLTYPGPAVEAFLARRPRRPPSSRPAASAPPRDAAGGMLTNWLRPRVHRWFKAGAHHLMRWHFRAATFGIGFDLYHEPNNIPLPCSRPTVTTITDLSVIRFPQWHPRDRVAWYDRHFRRGLDQCCHLITISEAVRQEILEHFQLPPERVSRTYMGIRQGLRPLTPAEVSPVLDRLKLPPRYLLHVGTLEPRKNLLLLLKAYCDLPASLRQRWPLLLVGGWGWNTAPLAEFFHTHARHQGVMHIGYVADHDLPALYSAARALVFPSFYEGFGLPPVEMMACGGAVLASNVAAHAEVTGGKGHLIDPHDFAGWRDAMVRVTRDDDWWLSLRQGVEDLARQYTWESCAADTLAVYRNVLGIRHQDPVRRVA